MLKKTLKIVATFALVMPVGMTAFASAAGANNFQTTNFKTMSACIRGIKVMTAHIPMKVLRDKPGHYTLIGVDSNAQANCQTKSTASAGTYVEAFLSGVEPPEKPAPLTRGDRSFKRKPVLADAELRGSATVTKLEMKSEPSAFKPLSSSDDDAADRFAKGSMQ